MQTDSTVLDSQGVSSNASSGPIVKSESDSTQPTFPSPGHVLYEPPVSANMEWMRQAVPYIARNHEQWYEDEKERLNCEPPDEVQHAKLGEMAGYNWRAFQAHHAVGVCGRALAELKKNACLRDGLELRRDNVADDATSLTPFDINLKLPPLVISPELSSAKPGK